MNCVAVTDKITKFCTKSKILRNKYSSGIVIVCFRMEEKLVIQRYFIISAFEIVF